MTIEYKIKFEKGGVTITQSVLGGGDSGGDPQPPVESDLGGDPQPPVESDLGGDPQPPVESDIGGSGGGKVIAVVLGPLVIGSTGGATLGERIGKPKVFTKTKARLDES